MELFGQQWGGNQAHVKPGTHRKPRGRDGNSSTELYTRTYASMIHPHELLPTCTEMYICTQTCLLAQTRAIINRHTQLCGKIHKTLNQTRKVY